MIGGSEPDLAPPPLLYTHSTKYFPHSSKPVFLYCFYSTAPVGGWVDSRRRRWWWLWLFSWVGGLFFPLFIWQDQCRTFFALPPSPLSLHWPSCKFSHLTGMLANRTGSYQPAWGVYTPSHTGWDLNRRLHHWSYSQTTQALLVGIVVWSYVEEAYQSRIWRGVNILGLNVDTNPLLGWEFMADKPCVSRLSSSPNRRIEYCATTDLSYQYWPKATIVPTWAISTDHFYTIANQFLYITKLANQFFQRSKPVTVFTLANQFLTAVFLQISTNHF